MLAKRRVTYAGNLLAEIGLEKERLRMVNVGAADARKFADIVNDMVRIVRELGPAMVKNAGIPSPQEIPR